MKRPKKNLDIHQQFAEFEQENPKVAEAMRLFGVSVEKYQGVLVHPDLLASFNEL